ncbi:E3 ubiquitin-protein ligase RNF13 [Sitodiplosis mosellana]|uniref:E3 ubiquitin-protein ligase RNF13 n=1 Tax=Sitodiplosis mosellana TaxID=263140 RepID=UPI0024437524|nr:E3 ubiquitin-protein ligase RNF13 [Sitodiplosis mosellana]
MHRIIASLAFTFIVFVQTTKSDVLVYSQYNNQQIVEEFHDLPSRFGTAFPVNGLRGLAAYSNPSNACTPINPPPQNSTKAKWIVLISRGECSFEIKVRNAQSAGFSAAIVHNVGSEDLESMSANNDDGIDIPSMFVGEQTGRIIMVNYLYDNGFVLVLNDDLPFNINTHLIVPFAIVVALCFIVMIGFMIMKCLNEQRRLRRHRLPGSVLKKIPIIRFVKEEHMSLYEICAICIEDYVDGDRLRVLPCSHAYHNKCIDPWLTKNRRVCPICKRKVFARGEPRRRRRRSTDDSMSDSDQDDTTPLINPVDHTNSHGTFNAIAPPHEESSSDGTSPQQRTNPFNRQPTLDIPNADVVESESIWSRILSVFHMRASDDQDNSQNLDGNQPNDDEVQTIMSQSQSNDAPIASYGSSSSNNVMNMNLSGSMQRFNRNRPSTIHSNDSDDDDGNSTTRYHECNESQTIFAPISTSQPAIINQQVPSQSIAGTSSHQRIAVAALPNLDYDQFNSRGFSASSPSLYSQPESSSRRNSDGSDQRRTDFARNTTAASNKYFV